MTRMKVAIAGYGVVGSGVAEMLIKNRETIAQAIGQDICLEYVVDIREVDLPEGVELTDDIDRVLGDPDVKVLFETIGGARIAYEYTQKALSRGIGVITSNKELVATRGDELRELARQKGAWYLCEAAVCGGVPVLRPLKTDLAGNRILHLNGIVNGSTNFLLTRMEETRMSFNAALAEAKSLGYLEADPTADVDGLDARRKLAILANAAFGARLSDDRLIPTTGIGRVTQRDLHAARLMGGALKLIAHARRTEEGWTGWVHPSFVPDGHPLVGVRDVFNGLCVNGDCVGDVMFYGQGAGRLPTASALIGDLVELARNLDRPVSCDVLPVVPFVAPDEEPVRAIIRVEGDVLPLCEAIPVEDVRSDGPLNAVLTTDMPLKELKERIGIVRRMGSELGVPLIGLC